jgi:ferric-dicitrate binding protein FerR (iron transport regulator)
MTACERAQQWISLELDGELSELEQAALARHLDACSACRAVSAHVGGFTWLLRDAPLVEVERPVLAPRPQTARARVGRGVAALAFAVAVGAVAASLILPQGSGKTPSSFNFRSVAEQKRFVRDHVRGEPRTFAAAYVVPSLPSLAARALR